MQREEERREAAQAQVITRERDCLPPYYTTTLLAQPAQRDGERLAQLQTGGERPCVTKQEGEAGTQEKNSERNEVKKRECSETEEAKERKTAQLSSTVEVVTHSSLLHLSPTVPLSFFYLST